MTQPRAKHVVVLLEHTLGYFHGVLVGLAAYFRERPDWVWTPVSPAHFTSWIGTPMDGIIGRVDESYADELQSLGVPVVTIANWTGVAHFPAVLPNDRAVGHMAAEFLIDLGLREFAGLGFGTPFSIDRLAAFGETLSAAGFKVHLLDEMLHLDDGVPQAPGVDPILRA